jgi:hypothetical protein
MSRAPGPGGRRRRSRAVRATTTASHTCRRRRTPCDKRAAAKQRHNPTMKITNERTNERTNEPFYASSRQRCRPNPRGGFSTPRQPIAHWTGRCRCCCGARPRLACACCTVRALRLHRCRLELHVAPPSRVAICDWVMRACCLQHVARPLLQRCFIAAALAHPKSCASSPPLCGAMTMCLRDETGRACAPPVAAQRSTRAGVAVGWHVPGQCHDGPVPYHAGRCRSGWGGTCAWQRRSRPAAAPGGRGSSRARTCARAWRCRVRRSAAAGRAAA